jgi:hypothetical protein
MGVIGALLLGKWIAANIRAAINRGAFDFVGKPADLSDSQFEADPL